MILREIIEIEGKIESLVIEKGGLVDQPELMFEFPYIADFASRKSRNPPSLLASLITHFRVIKLAYEGKLYGEAQRYQDFVYPEKINEVLRKKFDCLHEELNDLSK